MGATVGKPGIPEKSYRSHASIVELFRFIKVYTRFIGELVKKMLCAEGCLSSNTRFHG